eukprot:1138221-Pelagomonas_calceolata.AAC.4
MIEISTTIVELEYCPDTPPLPSLETAAAQRAAWQALPIMTTPFAPVVELGRTRHNAQKPAS